MTVPSEFRLLHHLPHLLRRAHFEADAVFTQLYGDSVTSRQLAVLAVLIRLPGISQSQVAAEIGLDLNTCSDLVARMVAKGLLRRERSPSDGRSFALYLTDMGHAIAADGVARAAEYQAAVAQRLTENEREALTALLRKLIGFA